MAKRDNTARLADNYELSDLEPGVDPEKAAAFLATGTRTKSKAAPRRSGEFETHKSPAPPDPKPVALAKSEPPSAERPVVDKPGLWTSRTIRLRQSTATCLTKAACRQKMKHAEGKLKAGEPVTVQEIADHGVRLVLAELGYGK